MIQDDVATVTAGRNDYRIHSWGITQSEAVDRMNGDLSKKVDSYHCELLFSTVMSNNTSETLSNNGILGEKQKSA